MKCNRCGLNNPVDAVNCLRCGEKLILQCEKCGAIIPDDTIFCIKCGYCHDQEANAIRLTPINKRRRKKKLIVAIMAAIGALAVGTGIFFGISLLVKDTMYLDEPLTPVGCHSESGDMVEYDGWVYYSTNDAICRMNPDEGETETLRGICGRYINVVNGWVYFENDSIYKMRTDGSHFEEIIGTSASVPWDGSDARESWGMIVAGDWIYSIQYNNDINELFRIRIDGTHKAKVVDGNCIDFRIDDNWIYYTIRKNEENECYRMRADGSDKMRLEGIDDLGFGIINGWLYDRDGYRINTETGETEEIISHASSFLISDGWIYYYIYDDISQINGSGFETGLFKVKIDGSDNQFLIGFDMVTGELINAIDAVTDNWVFISLDNGHGIVRTDGSDFRAFDPYGEQQ